MIGVAVLCDATLRWLAKRAGQGDLYMSWLGLGCVETFADWPMSMGWVLLRFHLGFWRGFLSFRDGAASDGIQCLRTAI